jgi:tetratricopeptide (TPR) repeat protein
MAQDNQVEFLHQQASALYLQGEYDAALEAWRQLLSLDPHDERAREGARLCELLVKEAGGSVAPSRPPGPPARPAHTAVGFGMGEQLDQELSELDELLGGGRGRDWMDAPSAKTHAPQDPGSTTLEFDLGDVPQAGGAASGDEFHFDVDAPDRPSHETGSAFDLDGDDTAARAREQAGDTAAEELQRRSNELMAEALEYYERGEREEALSALSRLTILDEHNEAALNFASHIRSEMEQIAHPQDGPVPDFATEPDFADPAPEHDPLDFGLGEEPPPGPPKPVRKPMAAAAPTPPPATSAVHDVLADDPFVEELSVSSVTGKGATSPLRDAGRPRPNKSLVLVASALVLVGGLYVVYSMMSGSSSATSAEAESAASAAALPAPPLPEDDASPAPEETAAPGTEPPAAGPLSPETRAKIDDLLNRGDSEFESTNFAAAVVSYNDALKLDPQNEVARKKLHEAGELFRAQKAKLDEREAAFKSFEEGDYRNALRLFYRFEPKDDAEAKRLTHYKAIGWYNLGVRALIAGDCRLARSNLLESQQLDALDPHLARAMEMNVACFEGASGTYYEGVRTLPIRDLED